MAASLKMFLLQTGNCDIADVAKREWQYRKEIPRKKSSVWQEEHGKENSPGTEKPVEER